MGLREAWAGREGLLGGTLGQGTASRPCWRSRAGHFIPRDGPGCQREVWGQHRTHQRSEARDGTWASQQRLSREVGGFVGAQGLSSTCQLGGQHLLSFTGSCKWEQTQSLPQEFHSPVGWNPSILRMRMGGWCSALLSPDWWPSVWDPTPSPQAPHSLQVHPGPHLRLWLFPP